MLQSRPPPLLRLRQRLQVSPILTAASPAYDPIKILYKSKCSSVDVCCIKVVRDVAIEKEEDEMEMAKKSSMDSNENKI